MEIIRMLGDDTWKKNMEKSDKKFFQLKKS
jgi:hypothetical protein